MQMYSIPAALSHRRAAAFAFAAALLLTACGGGQADKDKSSDEVEMQRALAAATHGTDNDLRYKVDIQRTSFGVPHITGKDLKSAAYGAGYVYAQDNFCLAADRIITVAGERSKYLGGSAPVATGSALTNLRSDFFYRNIIDQAAVDKAFAGTGSPTKDSIAGFVAGFNRFVRDAKPEDIGDCNAQAWAKRPLTETDLKKHLLALSVISSSGNFIAPIADAAPPVTLGAALQLRQPERASARTLLAAIDHSARALARQFEDNPLGSNGQAFGSDATDNGRGLLIGNPHFPWGGIQRFYQMHLRVPGELDVMGAGLGLVPLPQIGFNMDVAWTHTVSTGRRFTLFELELSGSNYIVDGVAKPLIRKDVTVDVLENGSVTPQTRAYYSTHYGPLLVSASLGLTWTATKAYALRDANIDNGRLLDQTYELARAKTVEDIRAAISRNVALPWVNTIAADRAGNAYLADMTVTPNVSAAHITACGNYSAQATTLAASRTFLLDGRKAACDWPIDPAAASPGIMAAARLPALTRKDYVGNSNESVWLSNPQQLLTGLSPIIGLEAKSQSLRTRMAFTQVLERLSGTDGLPGNKVSSSSLESSFFDQRMMSADLLHPSLLGLCAGAGNVVATNGATVDVAPACGVLANWDKRAQLSSVGTAVFREFWRRSQSIPGLYATPFSAANYGATTST